ncbi:hypothetical protein N9I31_04020 [Candidatus Pseudothioglobus singularis]|nr:hypothetical protein [Candidatus Pseudothioglobus singularis]
MDTQPWSIIASALCFLYMIINNRLSLGMFLIIPTTILIVSISILLPTLYYEKFLFNFLLIRGVAGYLSFILIFVVYYEIYKRYGFPAKWFYVANIIWLLVGVFQVAIDPYLFDFLLDVRTSPSRGVTGLAPEPKPYGTFLFFLNFIYLIQFNYKLNGLVKKLFILNMIFIFLVAQSASVIVLVFAGVMFFLFSGVNFKYILLSFFLILFLFLLMTYFDISPRAINLFNRLYNEGFLYIFTHDKSVFNRIMSIVYPYYSGLQNYLMPGGFNSFYLMPPMELIISDNHYTYNIDSISMSYFGAIFYELGFLSLFVFLLFFKCIYNRTFRSILEFVFLVFCLQFSLTIAYPLIPILLVTFWFRNFIVNGQGLYVQR